MLRVMLVDDEKVIAKGLSVLIDWESEGCEIVKIAYDGLEALDYLRNESVDLIIADIRMPGMNGLELLRTIREENVSDAYYVILSGYNDFSYCREAMRYKCMDYMVKPVAKNELLAILRKVTNESEADREAKERRIEYEESYLNNTLVSLLVGKNDSFGFDYVKEHMKLSENVRYINIEYEGSQADEAENTQQTKQKKLYEACCALLKDNADHVIPGISADGDNFGIGLIFSGFMADDLGRGVKGWLSELKSKLEASVGAPLVLIAGRNVEDIEDISKSYGTACILRSVISFREKKDVYFYEEELKVSSGGVVLCKNSLDALLKDISENDTEGIDKDVDILYDEMKNMGVSADTVSLNINYLLFRLVHLASEQDNEVDQEEILRYISESSFEEGVLRGGSVHLKRFAREYADYLGQLRGNMSGGVLLKVENEIKENYAHNLSLREMSSRYYINSSYLGQIFKKKYGKSFKEYLTEYRISKAADLLLHTDRKISEIGGMIGYMDNDYFLKKFIEIKGCTPSKFRKNRTNH